MTRYKFYGLGGGADILELDFGSEDGGTVYLDLGDLHRSAIFSGEADDLSVAVYRGWNEVRDLFGSYGILEQCPFGDDPDDDVRE